MDEREQWRRLGLLGLGEVSNRRRAGKQVHPWCTVRCQTGGVRLLPAACVHVMSARLGTPQHPLLVACAMRCALCTATHLVCRRREAVHHLEAEGVTGPAPVHFAPCVRGFSR
jgi:hypothetical protein